MVVVYQKQNQCEYHCSEGCWYHAVTLARLMKTTAVVFIRCEVRRKLRNLTDFTVKLVYFIHMLRCIHIVYDTNGSLPKL